jgi:hypothetical protein
MLVTKLKTAAAMVLVVVAFAGGTRGLLCQAQAAVPGQAQAKPLAVPAPPPIAPEQFAKLLELIKPGPGELRFREIPWLLNVTEARKKAAAEGKPILVWSGAGGAPLGVC